MRFGPLLRLDACELHDLGPLLDLVRDLLAERDGRSGKDSATKLKELRADLRVGEAGIDRPVEPVDDFGGRAFWRANAEQPARLITGNDLGHYRNVRQNIE